MILWPSISDIGTAIRASRQGLIAAGLSAIVTGATSFLGDFDIARLIYAALFAVFATGIYKMYRTAAVAGLCAYLLGRVVVWYSHGLPHNVVGLVIFLGLLLMFSNGIRGTFAYHGYVKRKS